MTQGKPYRVPDPRDNPGAFLVLLYKTMIKIEFDDRAWDKIYFARCMKRAMQLLETFEGDVQSAAKCMQELKERFESEGLSWTIETIIQYSFDWRADHQKKTDRGCLQRFLGQVVEQERLAGGLARADVNSVLKKMLELPAVPKEKALEIEGVEHD